MQDTGAHFGTIISAKGFQSGSIEAAHKTNVLLITWVQFQQPFEERWYYRYLAPLIADFADALISYTEPINSAVDRAVVGLPARKRKVVQRLRGRYLTLAALALPFIAPRFTGRRSLMDITKRLQHLEKGDRTLLKPLSQATSWRRFLAEYASLCKRATLEFDDVFGRRVPERLSNHGLQADGGTAGDSCSVVQTHVSSSFAPAAEPCALDG